VVVLVASVGQVKKTKVFMMEKSLQGIGIAFFTRTQWEQARLRMLDGHTFGGYDEFVTRVHAHEAQLRSKGYAVIRVHIDVNEFASWCNSTGRQVDARSRQEFAALMARKQDG